METPFTVTASNTSARLGELKIFVTRDAFRTREIIQTSAPAFRAFVFVNADKRGPDPFIRGLIAHLSVSFRRVPDEQYINYEKPGRR